MVYFKFNLFNTFINKKTEIHILKKNEIHTYTKLLILINWIFKYFISTICITFAFQPNLFAITRTINTHSLCLYIIHIVINKLFFHFPTIVSATEHSERAWRATHCKRFPWRTFRSTRLSTNRAQVTPQWDGVWWISTTQHATGWWLASGNRTYKITAIFRIFLFIEIVELFFNGSTLNVLLIFNDVYSLSWK